MSVRIVKSDRRLLGTWKSDKAKTTQRWGFKKGVRMTPKQRKDFFDIFGDLTLRFTKNRRYSRLGDYESFNKYEVLATDDSSVVLRLFEDQFKKEFKREF